MPALTRADRVAGCLLGGAAGDALGAPLEFMSWREIRRHLSGSQRRPLAPVGRWTDDTQLTLFTLEGLNRAWRGAGTDTQALIGSVAGAYLDWRLTQQADADLWVAHGTRGQLAQVPALWQRRAPGATCLTALARLDATVQATGAAAFAENDSKGCGGVMRAAPVGLLPLASDRAAYQLGCATAALTHGHRGGWEPAGALAVLVRALAGGAAPGEALDRACAQLRGRPGRALRRLLGRAARLALAAPLDPDRLCDELGEGWCGDECLALAVHALLASQGVLAEGLRLAVNHRGDSDSTGAVAGNLLGAWLGARALPSWAADLEARWLLDAAAAAARGWRA